MDPGATALLGGLAAEAVAQKCQATCLPLFAVARSGEGSAEEEAEEVAVAD